jgi:hypothetical protein
MTAPSTRTIGAAGATVAVAAGSAYLAGRERRYVLYSAMLRMLARSAWRETRATTRDAGRRARARLPIA